MYVYSYCTLPLLNSNAQNLYIKFCRICVNTCIINVTVVKNNLSEYACGRCCLVLRCILALRCILSVVFSNVLFLQAFSTLLHPYLQCVLSAAPVTKVRPLATVSGLLITWAVWRYFTVWLVERLVAGLFGIAFPLPPIPLYILVVGGCYSLACLQSSRIILFAFFFHSFISMVFIIYYYHCYYFT